MQTEKLAEQQIACFGTRRIDRNTRHRAHLHALRFAKMADAFGTTVRVDFIDEFAHRDSTIRALRLADVAVDTFVGDDERHAVILPARIGGAAQVFRRLRLLVDFLAQPSFDRGKHEFADVAAQLSDFAHNGARDELILIRRR
jgi:hypothetical protein